MPIVPLFYQKYKLLSKQEKMWYLDLSNVTMNIGVTNIVISTQLYHNIKWNIISHQEGPGTILWAYMVPTELVAQLDFDRKIVKISFLLERTLNIFNNNYLVWQFFPCPSTKANIMCKICARKTINADLLLYKGPQSKYLILSNEKHNIAQELFGFWS